MATPQEGLSRRHVLEEGISLSESRATILSFVPGFKVRVRAQIRVGVRARCHTNEKHRTGAAWREIS